MPPNQLSEPPDEPPGQRIARLMRRLHGRKPYIPVWAGADKRCFVCGEQTGDDRKIEHEEPFEVPRTTVYFVVCSLCLPHTNVDHARRTYVRRLEGWLAKLERKHREFLVSLPRADRDNPAGS